MDADQIIARCTRDGLTSWFNVARMLGCSVDHARAQHDPRHLQPNPFALRQTRKEDDLDAVNSPHEKGPSLRIRILTFLAKQQGTSEDIAARVGSTAKSVATRLGIYLAEELVTNDRPRSGGRTAITWTITAKGRAEAATSERAAA